MQDETADAVPLGPLLLAATAAAMAARVGSLTAAQVVDLDTLASAAPQGHPLRFAALMFCEQFDAHFRDPAALAELGEGLDRAIARALRPEPVDLARRDIHG